MEGILEWLHFRSLGSHDVLTGLQNESVPYEIICYRGYEVPPWSNAVSGLEVEGM